MPSYQASSSSTAKAVEKFKKTARRKSSLSKNIESDFQGPSSNKNAAYIYICDKTSDDGQQLKGKIVRNSKGHETSGNSYSSVTENSSDIGIVNSNMQPEPSHSVPCKSKITVQGRKFCNENSHNYDLRKESSNLSLSPLNSGNFQKSIKMDKSQEVQASSLFRCQFCGKFFRNYADLEYHYVNHFSSFSDLFAFLKQQRSETVNSSELQSQNAAQSERTVEDIENNNTDLILNVLSSTTGPCAKGTETYEQNLYSEKKIVRENKTDGRNENSEKRIVRGNKTDGQSEYSEKRIVTGKETYGQNECPEKTTICVKSNDTDMDKNDVTDELNNNKIDRIGLRKRKASTETYNKVVPKKRRRRKSCSSTLTVSSVKAIDMSEQCPDKLHNTDIDMKSYEDRVNNLNAEFIQNQNCVYQEFDANCFVDASQKKCSHIGKSTIPDNNNNIKHGENESELSDFSLSHSEIEDDTSNLTDNSIQRKISKTSLLVKKINKLKQKRNSANLRDKSLLQSNASLKMKIKKHLVRPDDEEKAIKNYNSDIARDVPKESVGSRKVVTCMKGHTSRTKTKHGLKMTLKRIKQFKADNMTVLKVDGGNESFRSDDYLVPKCRKNKSERKRDRQDEVQYKLACMLHVQENTVYSYENLDDASIDSDTIDLGFNSTHTVSGKSLNRWKSLSDDSTSNCTSIADCDESNAFSVADNLDNNSMVTENEQEHYNKTETVHNVFSGMRAMDDVNLSEDSETVVTSETGNNDELSENEDTSMPDTKNDPEFKGSNFDPKFKESSIDKDFEGSASSMVSNEQAKMIEHFNNLTVDSIQAFNEKVKTRIVRDIAMTTNNNNVTVESNESLSMVNSQDKIESTETCGNFRKRKKKVRKNDKINKNECTSEAQPFKENNSMLKLNQAFNVSIPTVTGMHDPELWDDSSLYSKCKTVQSHIVTDEHISPSIYRCQTCNKHYNSYASLNQHWLDSEHFNISLDPITFNLYVCEFCGQKFITNARMFFHYKKGCNKVNIRKDLGSLRGDTMYSIEENLKNLEDKCIEQGLMIAGDGCIEESVKIPEDHCIKESTSITEDRPLSTVENKSVADEVMSVDNCVKIHLKLPILVKKELILSLQPLKMKDFEIDGVMYKFIGSALRPCWKLISDRNDELVKHHLDEEARNDKSVIEQRTNEVDQNVIFKDCGSGTNCEVSDRLLLNDQVESEKNFGDCISLDVSSTLLTVDSSNSESVSIQQNDNRDQNSSNLDTSRNNELLGSDHVGKPFTCVNDIVETKTIDKDEFKRICINSTELASDNENLKNCSPNVLEINKGLENETTLIQASVSNTIDVGGTVDESLKVDRLRSAQTGNVTIGTEGILTSGVKYGNTITVEMRNGACDIVDGKINSDLYVSWKDIPSGQGKIMENGKLPEINKSTSAVEYSNQQVKSNNCFQTCLESNDGNLITKEQVYHRSETTFLTEFEKALLKEDNLPKMQLVKKGRTNKVLVQRKKVDTWIISKPRKNGNNVHETRQHFNASKTAQKIYREDQKRRRVQDDKFPTISEIPTVGQKQANSKMIKPSNAVNSEPNAISVRNDTDCDEENETLAVESLKRDLEAVLGINKANTPLNRFNTLECNDNVISPSMKVGEQETSSCIKLPSFNDSFSSLVSGRFNFRNYRPNGYEIDNNSVSENRNKQLPSASPMMSSKDNILTIAMNSVYTAESRMQKNPLNSFSKSVVTCQARLTPIPACISSTGMSVRYQQPSLQAFCKDGLFPGSKISTQLPTGSICWTENRRSIQNTSFESVVSGLSGSPSTVGLNQDFISPSSTSDILRIACRTLNDDYQSSCLPSNMSNVTPNTVDISEGHTDVLQDTIEDEDIDFLDPESLSRCITGDKSLYNIVINDHDSSVFGDIDDLSVNSSVKGNHIHPDNFMESKNGPSDLLSNGITNTECFRPIRDDRSFNTNDPGQQLEEFPGLDLNVVKNKDQTSDNLGFRTGDKYIENNDRQLTDNEPSALTNQTVNECVELSFDDNVKDGHSDVVINEDDRFVKEHLAGGHSEESVENVLHEVGSKFEHDIEGNESNMGQNQKSTNDISDKNEELETLDKDVSDENNNLYDSQSVESSSEESTLTNDDLEYSGNDRDCRDENHDENESLVEECDYSSNTSIESANVNDIKVDDIEMNGDYLVNNDDNADTAESNKKVDMTDKKENDKIAGNSNMNGTLHKIVCRNSDNSDTDGDANSAQVVFNNFTKSADNCTFAAESDSEKSSTRVEIDLEDFTNSAQGINNGANNCSYSAQSGSDISSNSAESCPETPENLNIAQSVDDEGFTNSAEGFTNSAEGFTNSAEDFTNSAENCMYSDESDSDISSNNADNCPITSENLTNNVRSVGDEGFTNKSDNCMFSDESDSEKRSNIAESCPITPEKSTYSAEIDSDTQKAVNDYDLHSAASKSDNDNDDDVDHDKSDADDKDDDDDNDKSDAAASAADGDDKSNADDDKSNGDDKDDDVVDDESDADDVDKFKDNDDDNDKSDDDDDKDDDVVDAISIYASDDDASFLNEDEENKDEFLFDRLDDVSTANLDKIQSVGTSDSPEDYDNQVDEFLVPEMNSEGRISDMDLFVRSPGWNESENQKSLYEEDGHKVDNIVIDDTAQCNIEADLYSQNTDVNALPSDLNAHRFLTKNQNIDVNALPGDLNAHRFLTKNQNFDVNTLPGDLNAHRFLTKNQNTDAHCSMLLDASSQRFDIKDQEPDVFTIRTEQQTSLKTEQTISYPFEKPITKTVWVPKGYCYQMFNYGSCDARPCIYKHTLPTDVDLQKSISSVIDIIKGGDEDRAMGILDYHQYYQQVLSPQILNILFDLCCRNGRQEYCMKLLFLFLERGFVNRGHIDCVIFMWKQSGNHEDIKPLQNALIVARRCNILPQKDAVCFLLMTFADHCVLDCLWDTVEFCLSFEFTLPLQYLNECISAAIDKCDIPVLHKIGYWVRNVNQHTLGNISDELLKKLQVKFEEIDAQEEACFLQYYLESRIYEFGTSMTTTSQRRSRPSTPLLPTPPSLSKQTIWTKPVPKVKPLSVPYNKGVMSTIRQANVGPSGDCGNTLLTEEQRSFIKLIETASISNNLRSLARLYINRSTCGNIEPCILHSFLLVLSKNKTTLSETWNCFIHFIVNAGATSSMFNNNQRNFKNSSVNVDNAGLSYLGTDIYCQACNLNMKDQACSILSSILSSDVLELSPLVEQQRGISLVPLAMKTFLINRMPEKAAEVVQVYSSQPLRIDVKTEMMSMFLSITEELCVRKNIEEAYKLLLTALVFRYDGVNKMASLVIDNCLKSKVITLPIEIYNQFTTHNITFSIQDNLKRLMLNALKWKKQCPVIVEQLFTDLRSNSAVYSPQSYVMPRRLVISTKYTCHEVPLVIQDYLLGLYNHFCDVLSMKRNLTYLDLNLTVALVTEDVPANFKMLLMGELPITLLSIKNIFLREFGLQSVSLGQRSEFVLQVASLEEYMIALDQKHHNIGLEFVASQRLR
ncbi:hypothetical protein ACF0H5_009132 [Mactra antiquata]